MELVKGWAETGVDELDFYQCGLAYTDTARGAEGCVKGDQRVMGQIAHPERS